MIPTVAAGDLEKCALAALHRLVVPGEMRRGRLFARRQQRHDGGVVAAETVDAADSRIINLGDQIALAHPRLDLFEDAPVHRLYDAAGPAHIVEFDGALDRALPIDE